jgi:hypothetical protein
MAVPTIDQALITEFSSMVHQQSQQIKARLRPYVQTRPMSGDVMAYDGLGTVEAEEVLGRHQPVNFADIEHKRRQIRRRRFVITLPIDASDVRGALLNPNAEYAKAVMSAMERRFDRVVVEAMFADVKTGREFENTVTYLTDSGYTAIDATAGMTYEKLLDTMQAFIDNEVGNDLPETFVLGISGKEHNALMRETELTSGDFTRQLVVDKGEIVKAAGFEVVRYGGSVANPMLAVAGGERSCFAMSTRGMCVGISKEFSIKVEERSDLIETTQVQIIGEIGAVRTEGKLIQRIRTTA